MAVLFWDTETTGKWNFKGGPLDQHQPHLIQLAMILDDLEGETIGEFETIVKIGEAKVDPGAERVHGISQQRANLEGIPLLEAVYKFRDWANKANRLVAHNVDFDFNIMLAAFNRAGIDPIFKMIPRYCTMKTTTDMLKLPGRYGYKWPRLDEAYRVLVDPAGFEGAHDALNDVRACREVYYAIRKGGRQ